MQFEGFGVPDLIADGCRLLIVGINPGLWTAASGVHFAHPTNRFWPAMVKAGLIETQPSIRPLAPSVPIIPPDYLGQPPSELWTAATGTHFCHPTNRFYPALQRAGIIDWAPSTETGMTEEQRLEFVGSGLGITNLVARATVRASELSREELRAGRDRLESVVSDVAPRVIAVAGVTAYRTAFGEASAMLGKQTTQLAGTELWVVPNPSGLNAHETTESLGRWYLSAANAAGLRD